MSILSKIILTLFTLLLIPGCISSLFKEPKPTFSNNIVLPTFDHNYVKIEDHVYPAWRHQQTGNIISVVSDCINSNYNLKTAHSMLTDILSEVKISEERFVQMKQRQSFYKHLNAKVDFKPVEVEAYSLSDNYCYYVVALTGHPDKIAPNSSDLKTFTENIEFKK